MGNCMGTKQQGGRSANSEATFHTIDQKNVYQTKDQVVASHKDFVVEYQDMKIFMTKYELHNNVIMFE